MRASARAAKVPAVAMVDALVCAISILLILIVLLSQSSSEPKTVPQADVSYVCLSGDGTVAYVAPDGQPTGDAISLEEFANDAARRANPASISTRIELRVPLNSFLCGPRISEAVRRANEAADATDTSTAPAFLLLDVKNISADAPNGSGD